MAGLAATLRQQVIDWQRHDLDPATQAQLAELLGRAESNDRAAIEDLTDLFSGRLEFGTAGLRAALGPGPMRMNRVVVSRAAAGLARFLLTRGRRPGRVIIGYDARHQSDVFARDSAQILAGHGFRPLVCHEPIPTPMLAFGVGYFDCLAGIMVTASHNPAQDNGYKVYLGDGVQIAAPEDAQVAAEIARLEDCPPADLPRAEGALDIGDELFDTYLDRLATLVPADAPRELPWVYTPLHGVGRPMVEAACQRLEFPAPTLVTEQADPDPDFPTVPFPNPEELGVLDLAIETAERCGAELVIANDPDADRCAVAAPIQGRWRMLQGDELGALLADDALRRGVRGTYATTIVSSSILAAMAAGYGQPFVTTLTGFKWIGRVTNLAYGYEEALGYCCDPAAVADKDGISALVRVLRLTAALRAEGQTLADRLDAIARRFGVHATDQLSARFERSSIITETMARLRGAPPRTLLGTRVQLIDLARGTEELPASDAIRLAGKAFNVVVRPSGTEPKLKCYLEARIPPEYSQDLRAARKDARDMLDQLRTEMALALDIDDE